MTGPDPLPIKRKHVLVWGLGRLGGGAAVTRWLVDQGARVTVMDRATADSLRSSLAAIADLPVALRLGTEDPELLAESDLVVVNPAVVKARSEFFNAITRRDVPWTTEINLFLERCPASVIGVTGSFGKSTTSAMIAAVLEEHVARGGGRGLVYLGGNIGKSLLPELARMTPEDHVVLELSSAQLEDVPRVPFSPRVAVLTNLHPHHLDRHGSFDAYISAKLNILGHPNPAAVLVIGDPALGGEAVNPRKTLGPGEQTTRDSLVAAGAPAESVAAARLVREHVLRLGVPVHSARAPHVPFELVVPGTHNRENAATAWTAARLLGVEEKTAANALRHFPGLPHRLEVVAVIDGVRFLNDSKATSPRAVVTALDALDAPVLAIVGGAAMDEPLDECVRTLAERCRTVACLGETGARMADRLLDPVRPEPRPEVLRADDLETAVRWSRTRARPGDVVLFCPGATSFDRYVNFEARGAHFADCVRADAPNHQGKQAATTNPPCGRPDASCNAQPSIRNAGIKSA
ncbi:MAG: UDP-N-acetylmuramoyl-L-alanine--D-glutamate ligase [Phycisphaerae bacterium]|nr:UDP-N-acetylmuramoyl-L-alanine--D-glutamate ligase [Planctomycetia bacterium]MCK6465960.1 UDP-N-acetylmuramoyl-L-alanine--D-glutamate ligase [Phycisphaerae bacterium]MCL4719697.1 UDP-N-acetylmuramoyl-L-alanine--D-glutamate ligase [Phycisphaerae bacterium]NUQ09573.1 UDP-N-acetylmuramoyl-L-alanine--D-glutamate ligase [Phycisphaerae bacterium]